MFFHDLGLLTSWILFFFLNNSYEKEYNILWQILTYMGIMVWQSASDISTTTQYSVVYTQLPQKEQSFY